MGKIISVVNYKGGVGKTTLSINLAEALFQVLAEKQPNKSPLVLLVDSDENGNTTMHYGNDLNGHAQTLDGQPGDVGRANYYHLLQSNFDPASCIYRTESGVWLLPSSRDLFMLHRSLGGRLEDFGNIAKRIAPLKKMFQYVVIDHPPSGEFESTVGLLVSDLVLCPLSSAVDSLEGYRDLVERLPQIGKVSLNGRAPRLKVVPTLGVPDDEKVLKASGVKKLAKTVIGRQGSVYNARQKRRPLKSAPARERFHALAKEVM